ncbi:cell surface protein [Halomicrobium sp. HM KBTZ05]|uniref:cell surface protein n=1 Tax=Halomicrobium sp. HM KBTZ05 TaxID=3242663 RepID=UPI0035567979
MTTRPLVLACVVVLAACLAVAPAGGVQSEPTLTIDDATLEPDGSTTVRVALDSAPDGLAGFEVRLALRSGVATVGGAEYPDQFRPTTDPDVGPDGREITIEAADLESAVGPGATNVTLATVTVEANGTGTAPLAVEAAQIDDDDGGRVDPGTAAGTIAVDAPTATPTETDRQPTTDAASGGEPPETDASGGGAVTTTGSGPGFDGLAAALALAIAALLGRRR